jgi:hypothetical protein
MLMEMAPAARRRAAQTDVEHCNLLTATPDEAALIIACALADPRDLLRLARACRRFATKCIAAPAAPRTAASGGGTAAAAQQTEMWSIIQEAGRRWVLSCTDQERGWVPRRGRESWLGLMWEVQSLRRGAVVFGRSHERITLSEGGSQATIVDEHGGFHAAASKVSMCAGRHYAQFTVVSGDEMFFGVIRPGWGVEGGEQLWEDADDVDGHCLYYTYNGACGLGDRSWEGRQSAQKEGDRIGMLLDLDQGSMTVYKNDERLGVMATDLSGEYCWAVSLGGLGDSARIESAPAPA